MKTQTSKKGIILRTFLLLPLVAILLYGFSETQIEFNKVKKENSTIKEILIDINKKSDLKLNGIEIKLSNLSDELYLINPDLNSLEKSRYLNASIRFEDENQQKLIEQIGLLLYINNIHSYSTINKINAPFKEHFKNPFAGLSLSEAKVKYNQLKSSRNKTNLPKENWETSFETTLINVKINKNGELLVEDNLIDIEDLKKSLSKTNPAYNGKHKNENVHATIFIDVDSPQHIINKIYKILSEYGNTSIQPMEEDFFKPSIAKKIGLDTKIDQEKKNKKELVININRNGKLLIYDQLIERVELSSFLSSYLSGLAEDQHEIPEKATIRYDALSSKNVIAEIKNTLRKHKIMKLNMEELDFAENANGQNSASKEQIAEYNTLAKNYNSMLSKSQHIQIKLKDVKRLEYIYGLMSAEQKANAEPFPDFPEPPPAPELPKEPKNLAKQEALMQEQEVLILKQEALLKQQEAAMNLTASELKEQGITLTTQEKRLNEINEEIPRVNSKMEEMMPSAPRIYKDPTKQQTNGDPIPPMPPLPPKPESPLDLVIELAKKDAAFYYDDKTITADKAIKLLKKNKNINIDASNSNGNTPTVRLSKKAIKVGNVKKPKQHSSYEYAIELKEKGAQFYYNDKLINAIVGLEILRSRKDLIVETYPWISKKPEVKIFDKS